jgi:putative transposase
MSRADSRKQTRRSIRFKGYDYSLAGGYFVTICVKGGECHLGDIDNGDMQLNSAGDMVQTCWLELPSRFDDIDMDTFIIMPNHMHGIIFITSADSVGAGLVPAQDASTRNRAPTRGAPTVGAIVGVFKSITTNEYIHGVREREWPAFEGRFWQRNYWERIIRNERELEAIRRYIWNNPASWKKDRLYSGGPRGRR